MKSRVSNILPIWIGISLFLLVIPNVCLAGSIQYRAHIAYDGWLTLVSNGLTAGQPGSGKEMQATKISLTGFPSSYHIDYQTHIAYDGWLGWVSDGAVAGTTDQAKQMEAIRIAMRGFPSSFHVEYRVYVQNSGWQSWVSDGAMAGTVSEGKAIEGLQIRISADSPQITSISPSSVNKGTNVTFTLTGTGFQSGFTAQIINENGQSWNITNRQYISSTQVKVTVFIGEGTATGVQKIKIINPDGQNDEINFTAVGTSPIPPTITKINVPGIETGDLNTSGSIDRYKFTLDSQTSVMVTLISTDFDTYLSLRDPTTGATIEDDNGQDPNATNSEISMQLPARTYIIYVSGLGTGTYTLVIRDFENDYYVHYKSICNKRGQSHIAVYPGPTWSPYGTPGNLNDWVAEWATVGGDNCVGRCGKGCPGGIFFECEDLFRYTQDCFNHDVCVKTFSKGAPQCMYIFIDTAEDCWAAPDCGGPYHIDPYLGSCDGKTPCYATIQDAINAANSGTTIKILGGSFDENLSISTSKNLILKGGFDATYNSQTSDTTINSLTIKNGKIIVDNVVIE